MNKIVVKEDIKSKIYEIRGKQVMLDSDLAKLYECKNGTKEINQAVKNNLDKFPKRFSWILSDEEGKKLLVKNFDQKVETRGGRFKNPRVFTEQGVAMLATILKTKIATKVSINIMDAFVAMRKHIGSNMSRISNIEQKVIEHDNEIKLLQECFDKFEEKEILLDKTYDAYSILLDIFKSSKKELIIIDRYTDKSLLDIIKGIKCKVIIITSNKTRIKELDIKKYNESYNNLRVIYDDTYHDRYFIIDKDKIYHSGNSINHIGYRKSNINLLEDKKIKITILNDVKKIIE